jgi:hypothetical protein
MRIIVAVSPLLLSILNNGCHEELAMSFVASALELSVLVGAKLRRDGQSIQPIKYDWENRFLIF